MTISYAAYCIIDSNGDVPEDIAGLQAGTPWNLPYREIGVVVSALARPVHDVVAGAVEHETVVERLMQTYTVLPMRFPTIFAGREAALGMVARHYADFRDDLRHLRNHVEFGLKVLWPAVTAETKDIEAPAEHGCECTAPCAARPSGTLYMQQRYDQHKGRLAQEERAARFGHKLDLSLGVLATAKRLRRPTAEGFAFDGVYLVNKDKAADFRRVFADSRRSEPHFRYLFSGPWPPYNFVTASAASERHSVPVANDLIGCLGLLGRERDA